MPPWRAIPRPVLALPWGSRSQMRTLSPTAASAVPRLIAVVVLPTPPFWLAMVRILGLAASWTVFMDVPHLEDLQDDPSRINYTGMPDINDSPGFHGFGQFSTRILPLVKERAPGFKERCRQAEEPV